MCLMGKDLVKRGGMGLRVELFRGGGEKGSIF